MMSFLIGNDHRKPIPKGQFHAHVQGLRSDGEKGFEEEFKVSYKIWTLNVSSLLFFIVSTNGYRVFP